MAELVGDKEKVKQALMLLMDKHWGPGRITRVRARIRTLPRWSRPFVGTATPINYLTSIVKENPSNAIPLLNLLDMVEKKHATFWEQFAAENKTRETALNSRIRNIHYRRIRLRQAYFIDACKVGHPLSEQERDRSYAKWTKLWNDWREEFYTQHMDLPHHQRLIDATRFLNEKMEKLYAQAKNSPETFGIKNRSQIASNLDAKLDKLRKKWNGK